MKRHTNDKSQQLAERRWFETNIPTPTVSEQYAYRPPAKVYAGLGGFKQLNRRYREWRASDAV
jgi:hypothetical protein